MESGFTSSFLSPNSFAFLHKVWTKWKKQGIILISGNNDFIAFQKKKIVLSLNIDIFTSIKPISKSQVINLAEISPFIFI